MKFKSLAAYVVGFLILLFAGACSTNSTSHSSLTGPSAQAQNVVYSGVQWDPIQIGRVVVVNPKPTPLVLTFMLWDYRSEFDQTSIAAAVYTIPSGQTMTLTVGTQSNACKVQRDLYEGTHRVGDTLNDLSNFLYAGGGVVDTGCKPIIVPPTPPVVPPVVVPPVKKCEDPKAPNYGQLLPCLPPVEVCKPHYGESTYDHHPKPCKKK